MRPVSPLGGVFYFSHILLGRMQDHVAFHQGYGLVLSPGNFKSRMKRFEVECKGMVVMIAHGFQVE